MFVTKKKPGNPEDNGESQLRRDAGLTPGQYPTDDSFLQSGRQSTTSSSYPAGDGRFPPRDTRPKFQRGPSSNMPEEGLSLIPPSFRERNDYDDTMRHDCGNQQSHRGGNGSSSRWGLDRERSGGRKRQNDDQRDQRGDEGDSKGWSTLRAAAKKVSSYLPEPYVDERSYGDEQNSRADAQIANMQEHIHNLRAANEEQGKIIADLRNKLQTESANKKSVKESANKLALAMESKDLFVGRQDSDDVVISRFGLLLGQLKTWSVPFADQAKLAAKIDISAANAEDLCRVAPEVSDLGRFLQTPKNARLFVRGWASLAMSEMLFRTLPSGTHMGSPAEDIWVDRNIAKSFIMIENSLLFADRQTITFRDLHDWRALTAGLVSKLDTSSKTGKGQEGHVSSCGRRIMALVGPWVDLDTRKKLEGDLEAILLQAVQLSQVLRYQRASWSVRHVVDAKPHDSMSATSDTPVFFNEAIMDDKHGDDDSDDDVSSHRYRKIVEIVVSPGLFKRGDTDGERFDFEACVERAEVRCYSPAIGAS